GEIAKRLGPAAWLGIAWAVIPATSWIWFVALIPAISDFLKGDAESGNDRLAMGIAAYIVLFAISAGLGIVPTLTQAALGGYAFGVGIGGSAALAGITIAALIGYALANKIAKDRVETEIHSHPKAEIVRDALLRENKWQTLGILILLRATPTSPFSLTNYAMNVFGVKLWMFVVATVVGMAPRTFIAAWIGHQASDISSGVDKPRWLIVTGILMTLLVLFIIAHISKKALHKITNGDSSSDVKAIDSAS
ncbi:MAG: TVP38/TMEM64 family protein, partial [Phycisphaerales bacterium]|nr:TVP38/TMEM64 family protein [Phycisphaerales bacterium]